MIVALDDRPLTSGHKHRGTGWYTRRLINALEQHAGVDVLLGSKDRHRWFSADIIHYPYFEPFFLSLPILKFKPTVVTVHDLTPILFPEYFPRGIKGSIIYQIQRMSLKGVKKIITDSEMSKTDIIQQVSYRENDIHVIYLAAGENFRHTSDKSYLDRTKRKYNLSDRFILYVGDLNPNKNIFSLLASFSEICKKFTDISLVIVGEAFKNNLLPEKRTMDKHLKKQRLTQRVNFLGFVPTEDLISIYNLASVYVQPSFYEGFALPVVEAMACGCILAVSDIPVHREICSDTAFYFDPKDTVSIVSKLSTILNLSDEKINDIKSSLIQNSKKFSWNKVADQTIGVYNKMLKHEH